jgi:hypothetical protein
MAIYSDVNGVAEETCPSSSSSGDDVVEPC